jgi:transposase-like protein
VQTIAKITPDDYSDLLAAVDEGVSQHALARRYGCAPSLIARHVAKANRLRELSDLEQVPEADLSTGPIEGSTREILEARIRDPKTPARDLANLANALARLIKDDAPAPPDSPAFLFRPGTLILEPGRRSRGAELRFRLMLRAPGQIEHLSSQITISQPRTPCTWSSATRFGTRPDPGSARPDPGRHRPRGRQ